MLAQPTSWAVPGAAAVVGLPGLDSVSLRYDELAAAIHLSGRPLSRGVSVDEVAVCAAEGVSRVGLPVVRAHADEARWWNGQLMAGLSGREYGVQERRLWGSGRRCQVAHDLAFRLSTALEVAGRAER